MYPPSSVQSKASMIWDVSSVSRGSAQSLAQCELSQGVNAREGPVGNSPLFLTEDKVL